MPKQNITYRGKGFKVDLPNPIRKGTCLACGTKGWTNLHHWKYEFKVKEVRKNTKLALKNTTELCIPCHDLADAIRKVDGAKPELIVKLRELKERFK